MVALNIHINWYDIKIDLANNLKDISGVYTYIKFRCNIMDILEYLKCWLVLLSKNLTYELLVVVCTEMISVTLTFS